MQVWISSIVWGWISCSYLYIFSLYMHVLYCLLVSQEKDVEFIYYLLNVINSTLIRSGIFTIIRYQIWTMRVEFVVEAFLCIVGNRHAVSGKDTWNVMYVEYLHEHLVKQHILCIYFIKSKNAELLFSTEYWGMCSFNTTEEYSFDGFSNKYI